MHRSGKERDTPNLLLLGSQAHHFVLDTSNPWQQHLRRLHNAKQAVHSQYVRLCCNWMCHGICLEERCIYCFLINTHTKSTLITARQICGRISNLRPTQISPCVFVCPTLRLPSLSHGHIPNPNLKCHSHMMVTGFTDNSRAVDCDSFACLDRPTLYFGYMSSGTLGMQGTKSWRTFSHDLIRL